MAFDSNRFERLFFHINNLHKHDRERFAFSVPNYNSSCPVKRYVHIKTDNVPASSTVHVPGQLTLQRNPVWKN